MYAFTRNKGPLCVEQKVKQTADLFWGINGRVWSSVTAQKNECHCVAMLAMPPINWPLHFVCVPSRRDVQQLDLTKEPEALAQWFFWAHSIHISIAIFAPIWFKNLNGNEARDAFVLLVAPSFNRALTHRCFYTIKPVTKWFQTWETKGLILKRLPSSCL